MATGDGAGKQIAYDNCTLADTEACLWVAKMHRRNEAIAVKYA